MPLLRELCTKAGIRDTELCNCIEEGFDITGKLSTGCIGDFVAKGKGSNRRYREEGAMDIEELRARVRKINTRNLAAASVDVNADKIWAKTLEEIPDGNFGPPHGLHEIDIDTQLLPVRFAVKQADGKTGTKIEVIDDYRRILANECAFWQ